MAYTFSKMKPRNLVRKSAEEQLALSVLRAFLDATEPDLVALLVNLWNHQGRAITYKQLREAILAGALTVEEYEQWQQEYTQFVATYMRPRYIEAMEAAAEELSQRYPEWRFDPFADGVRDWVENRGAAFVTEVTATQIEGLQTVIQQAAVLENMTVDGLSRVIRPMVGLTRPQAAANLNYYTKLVEDGMSAQKALDKSIRYAARQHRYRAYNIARTELAFAYNQGSYEGTKQAQDKGYLGEVVKIWCTADDERVCEICGGLEGKRVAMDQDFDFSTRLATSANPTIRKVPPAHPSCRCAVIYKEISPPIIRTDTTPTIVNLNSQ